MGKVTYKQIGDRDLREAEGVLTLDFFSSAGRLAQQAVEKNLKHYIDLNGDTNDMPLITTHNTIRLYERVVELGGLEYNKEHKKMTCILKSYYYDTNYPGDDFRELDKEEATDAVSFAKELISAIKWENK